MRTKQLLLLTLLLSASMCETISLVDLISSGRSATGGPVVDQVGVGAAGGDQAGDFVPPQGYVPCGSKDSCGEAKSFKNEKDFQDFIDKYAPKQQQPLPYVRTLDLQFASAQPAAASESVIAKNTVAPAVNPNNEFSGTNNQVQNVDEADLLKTDGTYIYTISNQVLSIILAYPSNQAKVMSKLNFKDFNPSALFLEGDYLAVFGTKWVTNYYNDYPVYPTLRADPIPVAATLSTSTLAAPSIGTASKMAAPSSLIYRPYPISYSTPYTYIKIYDVSNRAKPFLLKEYQVSGSYFDGRKLDNGFMYLITSYSFSYLPRPVPWFDLGGGRRDVDFSSIFWYPGVYQTPSAVNIISLNLANPLAGQKKVVTICAEYTNVMYMSEQHIYLTTSSYENGQQFTRIRKIFVWGKYIRPFADGKVVGTVSNQFFLDEYGQFLRIATTSFESGTNTNNVFVLNYFLRPYGSLTGIARTETIFSCRYVAKRLYLVTFRQVDPFFVISFRNHRAPQILGQLKVTGFSRYLHPYDETTIIGLGRQADANGRQQGLKISLFDVSDVTHPVESAKFEIEEKYAYSTAEWEHKAFLFSADKNLLVIPGYMDYNGVKFNGAFAFYITKTEVTLRSAIDHILNSADNFYDRNVERSLWINDLLYTKSKCLLRINKINESFDAVKHITIPCNYNEFPIIPL